MSDIFHGIARAFTIPKEEREKLQANKELMAVGSVLKSQLVGALGAVVDQHLPGSNIGSGLKAVLASHLDQMIPTPE